MWTLELKRHLLKRGYREQQISTEIYRTLAVLRENCLQQHPNQDNTARIPMVVIYHPTLPTFKLVTKSHLPTLHTFERLREAFSLPSLIAFCRPMNITTFLVRATLTAKAYQSPGNCPWGATRSKTCAILMTTDEFYQP